jgi:hypothetical protein
MLGARIRLSKVLCCVVYTPQHVGQMHPLSVKLLLNLSVLFGGVGDYARASQLGRLAAVRAQRFFRSGPSTVSTHATAGSYTFMVSFGISKCPNRVVYT